MRFKDWCVCVCVQVCCKIKSMLCASITGQEFGLYLARGWQTLYLTVAKQQKLLPKPWCVCERESMACTHCLMSEWFPSRCMTKQMRDCDQNVISLILVFMSISPVWFVYELSHTAQQRQQRDTYRYIFMLTNYTIICSFCADLRCAILIRL